MSQSIGKSLGQKAALAKMRELELLHREWEDSLGLDRPWWRTDTFFTPLVGSALFRRGIKAREGDDELER